MSLIDRAVRAGARPRSLWVALAIGFFAPLIALPYLLLVNFGVINHTLGGLLFFLALIIADFAFISYYVVGRTSGKYRELKGRSWSELPW